MQDLQKVIIYKTCICSIIYIWNISCMFYKCVPGYGNCPRSHYTKVKQRIWGGKKFLLHEGKWVGFEQECMQNRCAPMKFKVWYMFPNLCFMKVYVVKWIKINLFFSPFIWMSSMKASCTMYQKVKVWHAYLIFKEHFYTVACPKIATRHLSIKPLATFYGRI